MIEEVHAAFGLDEIGVHEFTLCDYMADREITPGQARGALERAVRSGALVRRWAAKNGRRVRAYRKA